MKSYLISDNLDTLQGMRLAGIAGEILNDPVLILEKIDALIMDQEVGIILITQTIKDQVYKDVMERKLTSKTTLIVTIPGPKDQMENNFITRYIRESIGIKL